MSKFAEKGQGANAPDGVAALSLARQLVLGLVRGGARSKADATAIVEAALAEITQDNNTGRSEARRLVADIKVQI
jgi:hypothetical protein